MHQAILPLTQEQWQPIQFVSLFADCLPCSGTRTVTPTSGCSWTFLVARTLIPNFCDLTHAHCAWRWSSMSQSTQMINIKVYTVRTTSVKLTLLLWSFAIVGLESRLGLSWSLQQRVDSPLTEVNNQFGTHISMDFKKWVRINAVLYSLLCTSCPCKRWRWFQWKTGGCWRKPHRR